MSAPFWGETPPATPVSPDEAEAIAREVFGVDGTARPLGSNQETNLRIRGGRGDLRAQDRQPGLRRRRPRPAEPGDAARRPGRAPGLEVPVPVPALDGADLVRVPIRWGRPPRPAADLRRPARCSPTPVPRRRGAGPVRRPRGPAVRRAGHVRPPCGRPRPAVRHPARRARRGDAWRARSPTRTGGRPRPTSATGPGPRWTPLVDELRSQVVHADLADYNVVAARDAAGRLTPTGVIDFGDVVAVLAGRRSRHRDHLAAGAGPPVTAAGRVRRRRRLPRRDAADRGRDRRRSGRWSPPAPACWPTSVDDILAADPDNDVRPGGAAARLADPGPGRGGAVPARRGGPAAGGRPGRRRDGGGGRRLAAAGTVVDSARRGCRRSTCRSPPPCSPSRTWTDRAATRAALRGAP